MLTSEQRELRPPDESLGAAGCILMCEPIEPPEYLTRMAKLAFAIKQASLTLGKEIQAEKAMAIAAKIVEVIDAIYVAQRFFPKRISPKELLEEGLVTYSQANSTKEQLCVVITNEVDKPSEVLLGNLQEKKRHAVMLSTVPLATAEFEAGKLRLSNQCKETSVRVFSRDSNIFLPVGTIISGWRRQQGPTDSPPMRIAA